MSGSQSQLARNWQPWPAHEMITIQVGRDSIQNRKRIRGGIEDIAAIVSELKKERDLLSRAIAALEGTDVARASSKKLTAPTLVKAKKGEGGLTSEGKNC